MDVAAEGGLIGVDLGGVAKAKIVDHHRLGVADAWQLAEMAGQGAIVVT
jgi:hypothetical protein